MVLHSDPSFTHTLTQNGEGESERGRGGLKEAENNRNQSEWDGRLVFKVTRPISRGGRCGALKKGNYECEMRTHTLASPYIICCRNRAPGEKYGHKVLLLLLLLRVCLVFVRHLPGPVHENVAQLCLSVLLSFSKCRCFSSASSSAPFEPTFFLNEFRPFLCRYSFR